MIGLATGFTLRSASDGDALAEEAVPRLLAMIGQNDARGRPQIAPELRHLIRQMWQEDPAWSSPRIVAELHKLGIEIAKSPAEKYKPRGERLPSPTWRTFLDLHLKELVAADFFIVPNYLPMAA